MRHYQDAASETLKIRGHSIAQFLQTLGQEATLEGLGRLSCEKIEQFFLDYAGSMGRSARRSMQSALRTFFRFCLHRGYIQQVCSAIIVAIRGAALRRNR